MGPCGGFSACSAQRCWAVFAGYPWTLVGCCVSHQMPQGGTRCHCPQVYPEQDASPPQQGSLWPSRWRLRQRPPARAWPAPVGASRGLVQKENCCRPRRRTCLRTASLLCLKVCRQEVDGWAFVPLIVKLPVWKADITTTGNPWSSVEDMRNLPRVYSASVACPVEVAGSAQHLRDMSPGSPWWQRVARHLHEGEQDLATDGTK